MKFYQVVIAILPIVFMGLRSYGEGSDSLKSSPELIKILHQSGVNESHFGMYASASTGINDETLLNVNSKKLFIPASISKLVTSLGVLKSFLPGHRFKTQLWIDQTVSEEGVLQGSLYLKGGGDPSFTSENMWFLVNHFLRTGVKIISGDIIVDDSLFDQDRFDESRQSKRVDRAYDAPVGAMSFNWNSVNIFVRPGNIKGAPAKVYLDPENEYTQLENTTKTQDGSTELLSVDRKLNKKQMGDIITVSGKMGLQAAEKTIFKNITHPDFWSGSNLKSFLAQRGVQVRGQIRNGKVPSEAKLVAEAESKPIQDILADMNKFSNNYVAEMLTKNIAAIQTQPATLELGMKILNNYLQDLGIPKDQYQMENPAGLTRDNKLSAHAMWKVIHAMRDDFRIFPELLTSLPIAGVDGTLKKRMRNGPAERWVRAKTGYLDGVVSLAGYAGRKDGTVVEFAFIFNGGADEAKIRGIFDKILETIVK